MPFVLTPTHAASAGPPEHTKRSPVPSPVHLPTALPAAKAPPPSLLPVIICSQHKSQGDLFEAQVRPHHISAQTRHVSESQSPSLSDGLHRPRCPATSLPLQAGPPCCSPGIPDVLLRLPASSHNARPPSPRDSLPFPWRCLCKQHFLAALSNRSSETAPQLQPSLPFPAVSPRPSDTRHRLLSGFCQPGLDRKLHEGRAVGLLRSLLYPRCLEECPVPSGPSVIVSFGPYPLNNLDQQLRRHVTDNQVRAPSGSSDLLRPRSQTAAALSAEPQRLSCLPQSSAPPAPALNTQALALHLQAQPIPKPEPRASAPPSRLPPKSASPPREGPTPARCSGS